MVAIYKWVSFQCSLYYIHYLWTLEKLYLYHLLYLIASKPQPFQNPVISNKDVEPGLTVFFLLLIPNSAGQPKPRFSTMSVNYSPGHTPLSLQSHLEDLTGFIFWWRDLWYRIKIHKSLLRTLPKQFRHSHLINSGQILYPVPIIQSNNVSREVPEMLGRSLISNTW